MKTRSLVTLLAICLLTLAGAFAQSNPQVLTYSVNNYQTWRGYVQVGNPATGVGTITVAFAGIPLPSLNTPRNPMGGSGFVPILVDTDAVTPTAVTCGVTPPSGINVPNAGFLCTITANFGAIHGYNSPVSSNDAGVQEAVNDACARGGLVVIDGTSGVSTSNITSATGCAAAGIEDRRSGIPVEYNWGYNGSANAYLASPQASVSTALGSFRPFVNEELITLATGAATTDSTANLLPANSLVLAVTGVVNTTITAACTGWGLGDPTTAARFTANDTTLTAGEAKVGIVQDTTGVASATTGFWQASAAKVRVTCAGGNPGAGKVRVTVYGWTITPPAS